tara:strand:- start:223 stop:396 length:174 start_codon:yes stop_codon:yes gene_type:complete
MVVVLQQLDLEIQEEMVVLNRVVVAEAEPAVLVVPLQVQELEVLEELVLTIVSLVHL